jgi:hypothetical protein
MAKSLDEPVLLEVDAEHAAAIGYVAIAWASFELAVTAQISILSGFALRPMSCLTSQIVSIHGRLTALSALVDLVGGNKAILKEIEKFAGSTYEIAGKRNRIIHDPWVIGEKTGRHYRFEISANRRFVFEHKIEGKTEIMEVAESIKRHTQKFYALWRKITDDPRVLESLREKYLPPPPPLP